MFDLEMSCAFNRNCGATAFWLRLQMLRKEGSRYITRYCLLLGMLFNLTCRVVENRGLIYASNCIEGLLRLRRRMSGSSGQAFDGTENVSCQANGPRHGRSLHHVGPASHARAQARHSRQRARSG